VLPHGFDIVEQLKTGVNRTMRHDIVTAVSNQSDPNHLQTVARV